VRLAAGWHCHTGGSIQFFIAIGVVVPIMLLRKKKEPKKAEDVLPPNEPLPPAS
jgi:hypothetical protein